MTKRIKLYCSTPVKIANEIKTVDFSISMNSVDPGDTNVSVLSVTDDIESVCFTESGISSLNLTVSNVAELTEEKLTGESDITDSSIFRSCDRKRKSSPQGKTKNNEF